MTKDLEILKGAALHQYPVSEWDRVFNWCREPGRPRCEAWMGPGQYSYRVSGTVRKPGVVRAAMRHVSNLVVGVTFDACLAVRYSDGSDSVAWHSDDEGDMGPVVVSVSYGSTRRFSVRDNATRTVRSFDLEHGDVCVMPAGFQQTHEHCIRKTKRAVGPRISLTFRSFQ